MFSDTSVYTIAFSIGLPLFWVGLILYFSKISGWSGLAELYTASNPFPPSKSAYGGMGNFDYKGSLRIGFTPQGLFIKIWPPLLLGIGHPPLLIPWSAIVQVELYPVLWTHVTRIHIRNGPMIQLSEWVYHQCQPYLSQVS